MSEEADTRLNYYNGNAEGTVNPGFKRGCSGKKRGIYVIMDILYCAIRSVDAGKICIMEKI
jgi:hypothetical protein